VKLEGGLRVQEQVKGLVDAGICVMGHLGMTPQTASQLGGYKVQGKEKEQAKRILEDAKLLDRLGVFSLVLECVPSTLAEQVTQEVKCPTIGIGAGSKTDGQVLVLHDMLGFGGKVCPKFVRPYASLEENVKGAVSKYRDDVVTGKFPSEKESY